MGKLAVKPPTYFNHLSDRMLNDGSYLSGVSGKRFIKNIASSQFHDKKWVKGYLIILFNVAGIKIFSIYFWFGGRRYGGLYCHGSPV